MDRWSVASLGQRTDIVRNIRQQQRRDAFSKNPTKRHPSPFDRTMMSTPGSTLLSHATPSHTIHRHAVDTTESLRLARALGILRRLAKQDEVLEERAHLCELTFRTEHASAEERSHAVSLRASEPTDTLTDDDVLDAVGDQASMHPSQSPLSGVSIFRVVERRWQRCVTEWEIGRLDLANAKGRAQSEGPSHLPDDNDDSESEDRALEIAIEKGATFDLSGVALRLSHLPAVVEFVSAAATNAATSCPSSSSSSSSSNRTAHQMRCQVRMPLRTVDLTDLETAEQAGPASRLEASRIVAYLCKLIYDVPSIVVLHLSEHCALLESHCAELQQHLEANLETLRTQIRMRAKSRMRRAASHQRNDRDELVNFFLWENTDRCGIMELDKLFRRDARKALKTAAETTLRRAQEKFTQQRLAVARQEFFDYVEGSMLDYYRQSLSGLIRQQLKFLQQQEQRDRSCVISSMSSALDSLVTANKISLHRLVERLRNSESSRREAVLALLREERAARTRECGAVSAFHLLTSMILHFKLLRGRWKNIFDARGELFLGPYMMPWMLRRVSFVTTFTAPSIPTFDAAPLMPDFASPGDLSSPFDASTGRTPGKKSSAGDLGESFRAARASVFSASMTGSSAGAAGSSLTDVSGVADAVIATQRTVKSSTALSPTGSMASRRSTHTSPQHQINASPSANMSPASTPVPIEVETTADATIQMEAVDASSEIVVDAGAAAMTADLLGIAGEVTPLQATHDARGIINALEAASVSDATTKSEHAVTAEGTLEGVP
jgi:hypothetical protein